MRILHFIFSTVLLAGGLTGALALAASRYEGAAQREIINALLLMMMACLTACLGLRLAARPAARRAKIAVYLILSLFFAVLLTLHAVGIDGILPHRNGTQNIGISAFFNNIDLFGIIALATALACRRSFIPAEDQFLPT